MLLLTLPVGRIRYSTLVIRHSLMSHRAFTLIELLVVIAIIGKVVWFV
jgi:prepilin-type N-terminal cleavage/methylation domain-containing protein